MEKGDVNKKLFLIFLFILLVLISLNFISAVCIDNDNGKNFYVEGVTTSFDLNVNRQDYCINSKFLKEYYCEDDKVKFVNHLCDCLNGRCTKIEEVKEEGGFLNALVNFFSLKWLFVAPVGPGYYGYGECTEGTSRICEVQGGYGVCKFGTQMCYNLQWGGCYSNQEPSNEVCDGKDNNCDGQIDNGDLCPTGKSCIDGECKCIPESKEATCKSAKCGINFNNCNNQVNCGTCASGTCQSDGTCSTEEGPGGGGPGGGGGKPLEECITKTTKTYAYVKTSEGGLADIKSNLIGGIYNIPILSYELIKSGVQSVIEKVVSVFNPEKSVENNQKIVTENAEVSPQQKEVSSKQQIASLNLNSYKLGITTTTKTCKGSITDTDSDIIDVNNIPDEDVPPTEAGEELKDVKIKQEPFDKCFDNPSYGGGDEIPCIQDAKVCPDGSSVGRNPKLGCEFDPCPGDTDGNDGGEFCTWGNDEEWCNTDPGTTPPKDVKVVCTLEARPCPDGKTIADKDPKDCHLICPGKNKIDGPVLFCAFGDPNCDKPRITLSGGNEVGIVSKSGQGELADLKGGPGSICGDEICNGEETRTSCSQDCEAPKSGEGGPVGDSKCQDASIPGITFSCLFNREPYGLSGSELSYPEFKSWLDNFGSQYYLPRKCNGCSWYLLKEGMPFEKMSCSAPQDGCDYSLVPDRLPWRLFSDYCSNNPVADPVEWSSRLAEGEDFEEAYQNTIEHQRILLLIYEEKVCVREKVYYIGGQSSSPGWMCEGEKYRINPDVSYVDWQMWDSEKNLWTSDFVDDCSIKIRKCSKNSDCKIIDRKKICSEGRCVKGACIKLDNGVFGYVPTHPDLFGGFETKLDYCRNDKSTTYSCSSDGITVESKTVSCSNGCDDAAKKCKEGTSITSSKCKDSDEQDYNGKQPNVFGKVLYNNRENADKCLTKNTLKEWYCYPNRKISSYQMQFRVPLSTTYQCSGGCSNGKCNGEATEIKEVMTKALCESTGILIGSDIVSEKGVWDDKNKECLCSFGSKKPLKESSCPYGWVCSKAKTKISLPGYSGYCVSEGKTSENILPVESPEVNCLKVGEGDEPLSCCKGLTAVFRVVFPNKDGTCPFSDFDEKPTDMRFICINQRDGICGIGENYCNSPIDCPNVVSQGGDNGNCIEDGETGFIDLSEKPDSLSYNCCPGLYHRSTSTLTSEGLCIEVQGIGYYTCSSEECGNGKCTTGENVCNCPVDCEISKPNIPFCDNIGTKSEGWYENNVLIGYSSCAGCTALCQAIGTKSEGWYSSCSSNTFAPILIKLELCSSNIVSQTTETSNKKYFSVKGDIVTEEGKDENNNKVTRASYKITSITPTDDCWPTPVTPTPNEPGPNEPIPNEPIPGSCTSNADCTTGQKCEGGKCVTDIGTSCTPSCTGKTCGSDGCGGSCGNQDNGCGTTINCGSCGSGKTCNAQGQCETTSECSTKSDCDDSDKCTTDSCVDKKCSYVLVNPDDGDPCTKDICNPLKGPEHTPKCAQGFECISSTGYCQPNTKCTGNNNCQIYQTCSHGKCTPECGNGVIEFSGAPFDYTERCEGGADCVNCQLQRPACGDGIVQGEGCDNGLTNWLVGANGAIPVYNPGGMGGYGYTKLEDYLKAVANWCSATCKRAECGNGILEPGESCESGGDLCSSTCENVYCGDGNVGAALRKLNIFLGVGMTNIPAYLRQYTDDISRTEDCDYGFGQSQPQGSIPCDDCRFSYDICLGSEGNFNKGYNGPIQSLSPGQEFCSMKTGLIMKVIKNNLGEIMAENTGKPCYTGKKSYGDKCVSTGFDNPNKPGYKMGQKIEFIDSLMSNCKIEKIINAFVDCDVPTCSGDCGDCSACSDSGFWEVSLNGESFVVVGPTRAVVKVPNKGNQYPETVTPIAFWKYGDGKGVTGWPSIFLASLVILPAGGEGKIPVLLEPMGTQYVPGSIYDSNEITISIGRADKPYIYRIIDTSKPQDSLGYFSIDPNQGMIPIDAGETKDGTTSIVNSFDKPILVIISVDDASVSIFGGSAIQDSDPNDVIQLQPQDAIQIERKDKDLEIPLLTDIQDIKVHSDDRAFILMPGDEVKEFKYTITIPEKGKFKERDVVIRINKYSLTEMTYLLGESGEGVYQSSPISSYCEQRTKTDCSTSVGVTIKENFGVHTIEDIGKISFKKYTPPEGDPKCINVRGKTPDTFSSVSVNCPLYYGLHGCDECNILASCPDDKACINGKCEKIQCDSRKNRATNSEDGISLIENSDCGSSKYCFNGNCRPQCYDGYNGDCPVGFSCKGGVCKSECIINNDETSTGCGNGETCESVFPNMVNYPFGRCVKNQVCNIENGEGCNTCDTTCTNGQSVITNKVGGILGIGSHEVQTCGCLKDKGQIETTTYVAIPKDLLETDTLLASDDSTYTGGTSTDEITAADVLGDASETDVSSEDEISIDDEYDFEEVPSCSCSIGQTLRPEDGVCVNNDPSVQGSVENGKCFNGYVIGPLGNCVCPDGTISVGTTLNLYKVYEYISFCIPSGNKVYENYNKCGGLTILEGVPCSGELPPPLYSCQNNFIIQRDPFCNSYTGKYEYAVSSIPNPYKSIKDCGICGVCTIQTKNDNVLESTEGTCTEEGCDTCSSNSDILLNTVNPPIWTEKMPVCKSVFEGKSCGEDVKDEEGNIINRWECIDVTSSDKSSNTGGCTGGSCPLTTGQTITGFDTGQAMPDDTTKSKQCVAVVSQGETTCTIADPIESINDEIDPLGYLFIYEDTDEGYENRKSLAEIENDIVSGEITEDVGENQLDDLIARLEADINKNPGITGNAILQNINNENLAKAKDYYHAKIDLANIIFSRTNCPYIYTVYLERKGDYSKYLSQNIYFRIQEDSSGKYISALKFLKGANFIPLAMDISAFGKFPPDDKDIKIKIINGLKENDRLSNLEKVLNTAIDQKPYGIVLPKDSKGMPILYPEYDHPLCEELKNNWDESIRLLNTVKSESITLARKTKDIGIKDIEIYKDASYALANEYQQMAEFEMTNNQAKPDSEQLLYSAKFEYLGVTDNTEDFERKGNYLGAQEIRDMGGNKAISEAYLKASELYAKIIDVVRSKHPGWPSSKDSFSISNAAGDFNKELQYAYLAVQFDKDNKDYKEYLKKLKIGYLKKIESGLKKQSIEGYNKISDMGYIESIKRQCFNWLSYIPNTNYNLLSLKNYIDCVNEEEKINSMKLLGINVLIRFLINDIDLEGFYNSELIAQQRTFAKVYGITFPTREDILNHINFDETFKKYIRERLKNPRGNSFDEYFIIKGDQIVLIEETVDLPNIGPYNQAKLFNGEKKSDQIVNDLTTELLYKHEEFRNLDLIKVGGGIVGLNYAEGMSDVSLVVANGYPNKKIQTKCTKGKGLGDTQRDYFKIFSTGEEYKFKMAIDDSWFDYISVHFLHPIDFAMWYIPGAKIAMFGQKLTLLQWVGRMPVIKNVVGVVYSARVGFATSKFMMSALGNAPRTTRFVTGAVRNFGAPIATGVVVSKITGDPDLAYIGSIVTAHMAIQGRTISRADGLIVESSKVQGLVVESGIKRSKFVLAVGVKKDSIVPVKTALSKKYPDIDFVVYDDAIGIPKEIKEKVIGRIKTKELDGFKRAAEAQAKKYPEGTTPGCFIANTQIQMADGTSKAIQDIKVGDNVVTYDVYGQEQTVAPVTTTFVRPDNKYRIIEYENVE